MNYKISDTQRDLYKFFLTVKDYEKIGEQSGYSFSTVCNILNQRTRVNEDTEVIIRNMNDMVRRKISRMFREIQKGEQELGIQLYNRASL